VTTKEMYRTFNCGVGLIMALPQAQAEQAVSLLREHGEDAWVIGQVAARTANEAQVEIHSVKRIVVLIRRFGHQYAGHC